MHPVLLHAGHFTVYSYGVMTVLGIVLAIVWPTHLAKNEGIPSYKMEGLGLVIVLTAAIGSKLLTAFDYPGFYSGGWSHFLVDQIAGKGGVYYGGFLLAAVATAVYCRVARLPLWQVADCIAPGLALAQGLGRIGCFMAGCCWGSPTQVPTGVVFTSRVAHQVSGVPLDIKIHPTQLYEAFLVLAVIPFLLWLRQARKFNGEVIFFYAAYYAVARFLLEFVRDDPRGYYFHGLLSTSQVISLIVLPVALFLMFRKRSDEALAASVETSAQAS